MKLKPLRWLELIVVFTVLTLMVTYFIPNNPNEVTLVLVPRYILSFVFIAFLPGYCLVNILFLGKNKLDLIESMVLSVALSFGLAGLVGLFLGLSPIGIGFTSITVSLSIMVLVLASVALVRKMKVQSGFNMQGPEQVSA